MEADTTADLNIPIAVTYPSQRETAKMLGVSESSLSRSKIDGIEPYNVGERGRHYSPKMILELAAHHRKRSLNEVAADIMAYSNAHSPEYEPQVRAEVEDYFAARATPAIDRQRFLEEAKRTLPRRLYEQIKNAYDEDAHPAAIQFVNQESDVMERA